MPTIPSRDRVSHTVFDVVQMYGPQSAPLSASRDPPSPPSRDGRVASHIGISRAVKENFTSLNTLTRDLSDYLAAVRRAGVLTGSAFPTRSSSHDLVEAIQFPVEKDKVRERP